MKKVLSIILAVAMLTVVLAGAWWDATNVDEMIEKNLVYQG